jgi:hypothetical protein
LQSLIIGTHLRHSPAAAASFEAAALYYTAALYTSAAANHLSDAEYWSSLAADSTSTIQASMTRPPRTSTSSAAVATARSPHAAATGNYRGAWKMLYVEIAVLVCCSRLAFELALWLSPVSLIVFAVRL